MTSLPEIRAVASIFPTAELRGVQSALCLYGAAFFGRNDVIHLHAAGIPEVTVVDIDAMRLGEMREVYMADFPLWRWVGGDALAYCDSAPANAFDLVTADPWTGGDLIVWRNLGRLARLARKRLVVGVTQTFFREELCVPFPENLSAWIAAKTTTGLSCVRLVKRSDHEGGVWWAVLEVVR